MEFIYKVLSFLSIDSWTRWFLGPNKVAILVYHNPTVATFKKHIAYLNSYYNFIPLTKLVTAIQQKDWSDIPKNSMVITFDDGHADNFLLLPTFKKYKFIPTIYLCTNVVGTSRKYWWMATGKSESKRLKKISNATRLSVLKEAHDFYQEKEFPEEKRVALSLEAIKEMFPYVHFGHHTQFHPIVTNLEEATFQNELIAAKTDLKETIPYPLSHFAFPNGDYTNREVTFLAKNGFQSARTIKLGWNFMNTNPFLLKANSMTDEASLPKLKVQLSGLFGVFIAVRNRLKRMVDLPS